MNQVEEMIGAVLRAKREIANIDIERADLIGLKDEIDSICNQWLAGN